MASDPRTSNTRVQKPTDTDYQAVTITAKGTNGSPAYFPAVPPRRDAILLRPFTTMVDWLSVMMMGPWHSLRCTPGDFFPWDVPNVRPGLVVHCTGRQPRPWRKVFEVRDGVGEKLATICCSPDDPKKFPHEFCTVQFASCTLPTGEWRELLTAMQMMGCEHMGVQRLDIAADGWDNMESVGGGGDYIHVVHAALAGHGRSYSKWNQQWGTYHNGSEFNGFHFGSRAGNKYMRAYRKKREMKSKGIKPHIVAAWKEALNGHDPMMDSREVGRLEIQLKGRELRRYWSGESDAALLADLHNPFTRVQVFASTVATMFDFRTYPTDTRARTARPMMEWDWSLCTTNAPEHLRREQRVRKRAPEGVKRSLGDMYRFLYLPTGDPVVLECIERQARAWGQEMVDYVHRKERVWTQEHQALMWGTTKRIGTTDTATLGFMDRLKHGADTVDNLQAFHDNAEAVAIVEDDDEPIF